MSVRVINIFAAMASSFLIGLFLWYTIIGKIQGIPYEVPTLAILAITYTILATHQLSIVRMDQLRPMKHPVPFEWVTVFKYTGFSLLLWSALYTMYDTLPLEPHFRRLIWLVGGLLHIWFTRRFVPWSRPETRSERDRRQDATDVRQDERDVFQDEVERRHGGMR